MTVGEQLVEAWMAEYTIAVNSDRQTAAAMITAAMIALGPPNSELRNVAMAYIGLIDQKWLEEENAK